MRVLQPGVALMLVLASHGCAAHAGGLAWSRRSAPLERVALGHTMDQVRETLGEPGGVALDATPEGQERVIWYYPAGTSMARSLSLEQAGSIDADSAGLCRVVFVDGRVADIRRPK